MKSFLIFLFWAFPACATFNNGRLDLFGNALYMQDDAGQTYECTDYDAIDGKTIDNLNTLTGALCHLSAPRAHISDDLKKIYQTIGHKQYCELQGLNEDNNIDAKDKISFEPWTSVLSENEMMFLAPQNSSSTTGANQTPDLYTVLFNRLYPNTKVQEVLESQYRIQMEGKPTNHAKSIKQNNELRFALNVQAKATVDVAFEKSFAHMNDLTKLRTICAQQDTFRNKIICDLMYQTLTAQIMNETINISGSFSGTEAAQIFKGTES